MMILAYERQGCGWYIIRTIGGDVYLFRPSMFLIKRTNDEYKALGLKVGNEQLLALCKGELDVPNRESQGVSP